jgi:hypothetical protein
MIAMAKAMKTPMAAKLCIELFSTAVALRSEGCFDLFRM